MDHQLLTEKTQARYTSKRKFDRLYYFPGHKHTESGNFSKRKTDLSDKKTVPLNLSSHKPVYLLVELEIALEKQQSLMS